MEYLEEHFQQIHYGQGREVAIFSKIDLRSGYHQLHIHDEDVLKRTSRTWNKCCEFLAMHFGLTNVLAMFMDLINKVFQLYLVQFVIFFVDDILIYFRFREEYEAHLRIVLQTLREHYLYVKFSKCEFWLSMVVIFGHVVSTVRIAVDTDKVVAILRWERLTTTTDIGASWGW